MAWTLLKVGEQNGAVSDHREWQQDSADDINNPPAEAQTAAPGSMAWTGDYKHIYNKKNDGTWADILE